ncbi:MAG: DUF3054 domain-containing protein [Dermabacter sp.]|nr:DUF3054 domain-containing protein [Dermabacter sp.]
MKKSSLAVLADILAILIFACIGVYSHYSLLEPALVARVAWPFLISLLVAHLVLGSWRVEPTRIWPHGVFIVAITVVGAMVIRSLIGDGTATSFVLVATGVITALLLGWRLVGRLIGRRSRAVAGADGERPAAAGDPRDG